MTKFQKRQNFKIDKISKMTEFQKRQNFKNDRISKITHNQEFKHDQIQKWLDFNKLNIAINKLAGERLGSLVEYVILALQIGEFLSKEINSVDMVAWHEDRWLQDNTELR